MFLLAILLIMFITGGIHQGNIVREIEMGGGACKNTVILLTYNTIIVLIGLIVGIIISFIKYNKIRFKWVFPIGLQVYAPRRRRTSLTSPSLHILCRVRPRRIRDS